MLYANIPGGGDGTGANVTLVNNGDGSVTLANSIVTAVIKTNTAEIAQLSYNGVLAANESISSYGQAFYWQGSSGSSDMMTVVVDPSSNGGNYAVIMLYDNYANSGAGADACRYFAMFRGSPGLYVTQVMRHDTNMPAGGADIPSLTGKLYAGTFNWLAQDTGRNQLMQSSGDTSIGGIQNSPKEVTLLTSGQLAGRFDCKYDFSGDLGSLGFAGWCSTNQPTNMGLWCIHPSNEYFTDGPMHKEILAQWYIVQATFSGVHYGFHPDMSLAAGEDWAKVDGPFFLYFNKVAPGTANPQTALYADAQAQTTAERGAWPYNWFTDTNYAQTTGRGVVTGKMVINDSGNPNASASNLWVGVIQQAPSTDITPVLDFQLWGKSYQYWTHTDGNGNFSISNVVAGSNYTLYAFGPGAIGQFQSQTNVPAPGITNVLPPVSLNLPTNQFGVTVVGGLTTNLGNVIWTPTRKGATVWEMGVPDRDTTEFRHGNDYWHGDMGNATNWAVNWMPWQNFNADFPNGVNYTVGQSHWDKDWDYSHGSDLDPATGNYGTSTWTINFNLPNAPTNGAAASIYFGIAASYAGPVIVRVNGTDIAGSTGFTPTYSDSTTADQAMIRMASHGIFSDKRINFSSSLLSNGVNTVTVNMRKGGYFSNMTMYDYIRLELAGYVPPSPAGLSASVGNSKVALFWPAAPGATSYNVLRSTTSGSGYTAIATNVVGPTCGSVDDTAVFTDTNTVNGTTYYYVVRSINPNGSSTNSVQASAAPTAGSAPGIPVNLTATAGDKQVTLNWNASAGAYRYIIQRTVLTIGAVTTYTPGGINPYATINSYVTGTNYTDTALANNAVYSYQVSAANANGQSAFTTAANAMPSPSISAAPTGLSASVITNQITVSWPVVSNAANYIISRAPALAGPYTVIDNPEPLASSVDSGLNYNTTYYYKVAAANLGGISTNSTAIAVTTTPAAPSSIVAVPGNAQVLLLWSSSAGATNYFLQRSLTNGGPYATIYSTTNTTYVNTAVTNGTTYYYVVYAVGPNGTSPLSAQASATPSNGGGSGVYWINSITTSAQDWNANTNWSNLTAFPNAAQTNAIVNSGISANQTINLNQNIIIGELDLGTSGGTGAFNVAGNGGTLIFDNLPFDATLIQLATSKGDTISAPMTVNGGLVVQNLSSNIITLSGNLSGATNGITLNGKISLNDTNTFSGGTTINTGSYVVPGSTIANSSCWGSGPVTFTGGTLQIYGYGNNTGDWGTMTNTLNVPEGENGTLLIPGRWGYYSAFSSPLTGAGNLNLTLDYIRDYFAGDWSAFTGQLNIHAKSGSGDFQVNNNKGYGTAAIYLASGVRFGCMYNSTQTIDIGEMAGEAGATFGTCDQKAGTQTWRVGGRNTSATFAGAIVNGANPASVIKVGNGTWAWTGTNTFSGTMTISNGIIQIGNGGTTGTLGAGNVADNATLAFNRADDRDDTGFGIVSGSGVLDKLGAGRLALTKSHTYSGATLVEVGTLALTNAGAIASSSGINISAGALFDVSGKTGGSMTLASGKTLSGFGSVSGNFVVGSGATLAPGGSIGTLTFNNALTFAVGSTNLFEISKNPLTNDSITVVGAIAFGGTLIVTNINEDAMAGGESFKLFSAASYSGSFSKIVLPVLNPGLMWNTNLLNTSGVISVAVLTSPRIAGIQNAGGNLTFSGSGGTANWPYYILMATNLTSGWTALATNQFDSTGNFSFTVTNAVNAGPRQAFYKVQLQ